MITAEVLANLRKDLQLGEPLTVLLRLDSDRKLTEVDGVLKGKYSRYFLVEYKLKEHVIKKSYSYQDLLCKTPTVFRKKEEK